MMFLVYFLLMWMLSLIIVIDVINLDKYGMFRLKRPTIIGKIAIGIIVFITIIYIDLIT